MEHLNSAMSVHVRLNIFVVVRNPGLVVRKLPMLRNVENQQECLVCLVKTHLLAGLVASQCLVAHSCCTFIH